MNSKSYFDYIKGILLPLGNISTRKMFGGYGFYKDGIFFALIANDILYFKVDDDNRADYESYNSRPFSYEGKNKKMVVMSYWEAPVEILEDYVQLVSWVNKAVQAARRAKTK